MFTFAGRSVVAKGGVCDHLLRGEGGGNWHEQRPTSSGVQKCASSRDVYTYPPALAELA